MAALNHEVIDVNKIETSMSTELRTILQTAGLSHFFKPIVEHNIHKVVDVKALTDAQLMEKIGFKKGHGKLLILCHFFLIRYTFSQSFYSALSAHFFWLPSFFLSTTHSYTYNPCIHLFSLFHFPPISPL